MLGIHMKIYAIISEDHSLDTIHMLLVVKYIDF